MKSALALVILPLALSGCHVMKSGPSLVGSGKMKTETRSVTAFTAIKLDTPAEVNVVVGEGPWLEVTADDNFLSSVTTEVDGDILKIRTKNGSYTNTTLRIAIKVPSLVATHINGSGDVRIQGLKGESFDAEIDGSGNIEADGTAKKVVSRIDGSGDIKLSKVKAEFGEGTINGSGEILLHATQSADAMINGSGTIRVSGGAQVDSKINGSGEVVKI